MPCDTVNTVSLNLDKTDFETMLRALEALGKSPQVQGDKIHFTGRSGYGWTYTRGGQLDMRGTRTNYDDEINEIKRGYSAEIIRGQAKKFGWQVTPQESQDRKQMKFRLQARSR